MADLRINRDAVFPIHERLFLGMALTIMAGSGWSVDVQGRATAIIRPSGARDNPSVKPASIEAEIALAAKVQPSTEGGIEFAGAVPALAGFGNPP